jgi:hypothetical protein
MGYDKGRASGSDLFRQTSKAFQRWMDDIFRPHNVELEKLLLLHANDSGIAHIPLNFRDARWAL